jgi:predicted N-formylglutamate amidohydrolase
LLRLLREDSALCVGDNEPYAITDTTDYTLPFHGEKRGLAHVGIEIRQDLVGHDLGQQEWAERLARLLTRAAELL